MSARFHFLAEPATPALDVLIASGADNLFVIFGERIAVKGINHLGDEVMRVFRV